MPHADPAVLCMAYLRQLINIATRACTGHACVGCSQMLASAAVFLASCIKNAGAHEAAHP
jgi:hypothetical protein